MASKLSIKLKNDHWRDLARLFHNNRKNPRETRPRDRTLRGEQRRDQRKFDNKASRSA